MIKLPALLKARIWLVVALTTQIAVVLLPHETHFAVHFPLAFCGLLFAAFSGGFYMQDLVANQIMVLVQEHLTDEEIKQALDATMR